jgi:phage regulator Rha-like protein
MNNLTAQQTLSSLEIARLVNRVHFNVVRDITKILYEVGIDSSKFEGAYIDDDGQTRLCYNLPLREAFLVTDGYTSAYRLVVIDSLLGMV